MLCHQITVFILIFCIVRKTKTDSFQMQVLEARQLYPFRGYKDVQMFHYIVPPEVAFASFQYKANGSFQCPPKRIAVYLQYGSFPVMTLQNASYPDFFSVRRMHLHNVTLMSDMVPLTVNVSNPLPGNWYAAAFLLENTERIAQKGLFKSCLSWLSSTLKLNIVTNVISLLQNEKLKQNISGSQIYRFFALKNSWITSIELKNCLSSGRCSVMMMFRRLGMPTFTAESDSFIACNDTSPCILKVIPAVSHWNYIYIQNKEGEPLQFDLVIHTQECVSNDPTFLVLKLESPEECQDSSSLNDISEAVEVESDGLTYFDTKYETNFTSENSSCWPRIPLIRISLPTNLAYEYNLPPDKDDSYPVILNVSNTQYTLTDFEVLPIVDIGGTLVIELAVSPFMNLSHYNVSVSGCLSYGVRPSSEDVNCSSGISLNVNTSSWDNRFATRFVPYPEAGTWYFRLNTKCYIMNDTNDSIACDLPKTPVFLRIRSTPCVLGHCGNYGTCYQYVSGGLIFSTCNCIAGWKGWGCTDNSTALSDSELLLDVLLLTLSNLLFIPAIILSASRKYFTEAFVYFATMLSSTFYHACDAEVYSYCLIRLSVLQFCDFYSAILSVWVTLIAMAKLPNIVQSFTHMAGAVGVALGVEYDRTGLWVFVLPTGIGLLILFTSWANQCRKKHVCYPTHRVWLFFLLPGALLALSGLIIYAFFETKDNYPFVHSAWHVTIALSVLFLLPRRELNSKSTPEATSSCSYIRVGDVVCQDISQPSYAQLLAPTP